MTGICSSKARRCRGASSVEYVLVLAVVVLPLGAFLIPLCTHMLTTVVGRIALMIRLPFG